MQVQNEDQPKEDAFQKLSDEMRRAQNPGNIKIATFSDSIPGIETEIQYDLVFDEESGGIRGTSEDDKTPNQYKTIIISADGDVRFDNDNTDGIKISLMNFHFVHIIFLWK